MEPTVDDWVTWSCVFAVSGFWYIGGLVMTEKEDIMGYSSKEFDGCLLHFTLLICEGCGTTQI